MPTFLILGHAFLKHCILLGFLDAVSAAPITSNFFALRYRYTAIILERGVVSPTNDQLLRNSLGFAVLPVCTIVLRFINKAFVIRKFHVEDVCMLAAIGFYIALLVLINVSARYATNLYLPEQAIAILADPKQVADRILGSKIVVGLEQSMMAVTWLVKLCIWFFLKRICAFVRSYEVALYLLLGYVVIGFIAIEISYFVVLCRPFYEYWAMPPGNPECATYHTYSVVQMVFNISSDLMLFFLPTWVVLRSKMSAKRRMICLVPFTLALLTIIFAILNKYYNFASPETTTYQLWYIRESSMAVAVANLICSWQLFKKVFKLTSLPNFAQAPIVSQTPNPMARNSPLVALGNRGIFYRDGARVIDSVKNMFGSLLDTMGWTVHGTHNRSFTTRIGNSSNSSITLNISPVTLGPMKDKPLPNHCPNMIARTAVLRPYFDDNAADESMPKYHELAHLAPKAAECPK